MARKLRFFNGRGHGKYNKGTIYVAAFSMAEAARLVSKSCYPDLDRDDLIRVNEIKNYYSPCWGNPMDGINPTEPGVWATEKRFNGKPEKIL